MAYGYITPLHEDVERTHVRFHNRCGIAIAGDLYTPRDAAGPLPALIIGAPYGGVKEQGPCVYANELARRGFAALTFDQVFMGESGGEPRHISSPELFAESFSAAVDYLGTRVPRVDRERIGVIGICGSGGFALSAAAVDVRIKAVATAVLYDITGVRDMLQLTPEAREEMKKSLALQRWEDYAAGEPLYRPTFPEEPLEQLPETDPITDEWNRFYAVRRGHHPNARGGFTVASNLAMMQFSCLTYVQEIAPRPILLITGDRAHSKAFSQAVYARAAEPKELFVVKDAEHIDLYDRVDRIPFDKLESFFKAAL